MPRKPKRAAPDVPAKPERNADWSWGPDSGSRAGRGGTAEGGRSAGASRGGKAGTRAKAGISTASAESSVSDAEAAPSGARKSTPARAGAGGKAKVGAKARTPTRLSTTPKGMPGTRGDLSRVEVEAIREFALEIARKGAGPDTVLICNPISEPSALPAKELLYDRCRWCETDIYYDRLMPSPPDLMRVCLKCGILLLEAEKKGKN